MAASVAECEATFECASHVSSSKEMKYKAEDVMIKDKETTPGSEEFVPTFEKIVDDPDKNECKTKEESRNCSDSEEGKNVRRDSGEHHVGDSDEVSQEDDDDKFLSEEGVNFSEDSDKAKTAAMSHLNLHIGRSVAGLATVPDLVQQLHQTILDMEKKLQFVSSAAAPDQLSDAVQAADGGLRQANHLQQEAGQLEQQFVSQQETVSDLLADAGDELNIIQQLDRLHCYQESVQPVQAGSCKLQSLTTNYSSENQSAVERQYSLLEDAVTRVVGSTACINLHTYLLDTLAYWHGRLLTLFTSEFENLLKTLKYPFITGDSSVKRTKPSDSLILYLRSLIKILLKLHKPPNALSTIPLRPSTPYQNKDMDDSKLLAETASDSSNKSVWESITSTSEHEDATATQINKSASSSTVDSQNRAPASNNDSLNRSSSSNLDCHNESVHSLDTTYSSACSTPRKDNCSSKGPAILQPAIVADFAPLVTPLQLLLKPLEIRFLYHFSGSKKTNSAAHPEWCLTRVLQWLDSHGPFWEDYVQPALRGTEYTHLWAKTEVTRGLVRLVVLKLSQDFPALLPDEDLFCHCLQETLHFDRELRLASGYPLSQPSVLAVLTQPQVFTHWIELERKFAVALMDELVISSGAWQSDEPGGQTTCGEQLATLTQAITDRYKPLPQPGHRLQFLEVQLDVLDDFRVRAVQVARPLTHAPLTSHYPAILNTLHQLGATLEEWGEMPFFLELQVYRNRCRDLETALETGERLVMQSLDTLESSVFGECVELYRHVVDEMMTTLRQHVTSEVRARFMPYRRDKWFVERKSPHINDVSGSLCPLLEVLARQLFSLRTVVDEQLFTPLWQCIAADIDKFLFEELITENHFSEWGCLQFEYDMTKALFPMFSEFSTRPQIYFPLSQEGVTLLRLSLAPSVLLRDTLRDCLQGPAQSPVVVTPEAALADHLIYNIPPQLALNILMARNDISSL